VSNTDSELFQTAIKLAQEATALDNAKKYEEAYNKYISAAESLLEFKKFNKNPKLVQLADQRANQYISRAKILQETMTKKQKVKTGSAGAKSEPGTKTSGAEGTDKEGSISEELSDDEKELRAAIEGSIITEKPSVTWADIAGMEDAKQA
jgi:vacuolar protein-sorting-associated protein 4